VRLARYNEIVLALAGTAFLLGLAAMAGFLLLASVGSRPQPGIIVNPAKVEKPAQNLVFCPPLTEASGSFQYIPVGVVVASDARRNPVLSQARITSSASRSFSDCDIYRYGAASRTFNVVIRNMTTGEQRLLMDKPGQVASFELPAKKCSEGKGKTPCGSILWEIRTEDTNRDGTINEEDALVAFVSDLSASALKPLTSHDTTLLEAQWVPKAEKWQLQIRRDTNKDGRYTDEDGAELLETSTRSPSLAQPFLEESIMKTLNAAAR